MVVRQGTGTRVVVTATVHGVDQKTADLMTLQEVRDSKTGHPTLRMIYPLNQHTTYRYGRDGNGGGFFESMFGGRTTTTYDGTRVTVSGGRGLALYADLVVEIPRGASGTFRNAVGAIRARASRAHSSSSAPGIFQSATSRAMSPPIPVPATSTPRPAEVRSSAIPGAAIAP